VFLRHPVDCFQHHALVGEKNHTVFAPWLPLVLQHPTIRATAKLFTCNHIILCTAQSS
jgi:hypothetical protein